MRFITPVIALSLVALGVPALAQDRLSVADAVSRALAQNPAIRATAAATGEASARVAQARAGYLPRVSLLGNAQRGNQPVFAFSSLLSARQFAASNFAIETLNNPNALSSYQSSVAIEQPIFDGLRTRAATRSAQIGETIAQTEQQQTREDIVLNVTRSYGQVLLAGAERRAAASAGEAAEQDVARAQHRRDAGLASEADVLALQVHLAQMRAREIKAASDETVARAELNQAMGEPLDRQFTLDDVTPAAATAEPVAELEREAIGGRPEIRTVQLQQALARETAKVARGALLPEVSAQGLFNLNGVTVGSRASGWLVGLQARWNLFSGFADVARVREAGLASDRVAADRERIETAVRVDVRTALSRVQSAAARQHVGEAAVAQALESQRIIRDRYEAGMAPVTDVLRAANALLDAQQQRTGAIVDLLVSNAMLDRALGRAPAHTQKQP